MRDNDVYLWLHRCLREDATLSRHTVREEFESEADKRNFAFEYLERLTRKGAVVENEGLYAISDADAERRAYYNLFDSSPSDAALSEDVALQPVLSVPTKLQDEWERYAKDAGIPPGIHLQSALTAVLHEATEELRIVAPFFEINGFNLLNDPFLEAARRGVSTQIIVRGTQRANPDYSGNKRLKAVNEARDRYQSAAAPSASIEIRDYHHEIGVSNTKLDRSIHAKQVIADATMAYVGSGEIRDSSMSLNAESGVIVNSTSQVAQFSTFFDFFWERAEEIVANS